MSDEIDFNAYYPQTTLESAFWCPTDAAESDVPRVVFGELVLHARNAFRWNEIALNDEFLNEWARWAGFSLEGIALADAYDLLLEVLLGCTDTELGGGSCLRENAAGIADGTFPCELPDLAITLSRTYVKALLVEAFDNANNENDILNAMNRRSTRH